MTLAGEGSRIRLDITPPPPLVKKYVPATRAQFTAVQLSVYEKQRKKRIQLQLQFLVFRLSLRSHLLFYVHFAVAGNHSTTQYLFSPRHPINFTAGTTQPPPIPPPPHTQTSFFYSHSLLQSRTFCFTLLDSTLQPLAKKSHSSIPNRDTQQHPHSIWRSSSHQATSNSISPFAGDL